MKVRYIYSACIEIETTNNLRILCDPWFSEGIYDGSWYHFPKIKDPLKIIRNPDLIYISHIHPDHYDPNFLKKLFKKYGEKKILIPKYSKNYLLIKSKFDIIKTTPIDYFKYKGVNIHIVPNETGSDSDIDSALIVNDKKTTILNLNDCIWNSSHSKKIKNIINKYKSPLKLMAVSHAGAGPYPQTYFNLKTEKKLLLNEAEKKKSLFFKRYKQYTNYFNAKYNLPFAGKYILGGKLANLNKYRGVSDPVEVLNFDKKAIILDDFGKGEINLKNDKITKLRKNKYQVAKINKLIKQIKKNKLDYEKEIKIDYEKINFLRLLNIAFRKACSKSEIKNNYFFIIKILDNDKVKNTFLLKSSNLRPLIKQLGSKSNLKKYKPRSEIIIDYRYLFGLLTGLYHWNNAEVGSQFLTRRFPNKFSEKIQNFFNFFSLL